MHLLIVGCGYIGSALARAALKADASTQVSALRRRTAELPSGVRPVPWDLTADTPWPLGTLAGAAPVDAVVFCAAPASPTAEGYEAIYVSGTQRVLAALQACGQAPRRVVFVSSTSVYGQNDGATLDETALTAPERYQGQIMLRAEAAAQAGAWQACALRCGGIYGPGRDGMVRRMRAGSVTWPTGTHYTNRMHRDDCVGAIMHLLGRAQVAQVYNGVDDHPADQAEVLLFLAQRLGVSMPPAPEAIFQKLAQTSTQTPASGKRVSNALLRAHGYRCHYPTYKEGYDAILRDASVV